MPAYTWINRVHNMPELQVQCSMYVCMYVSMYVCIYVYMYVGTYSCLGIDKNSVLVSHVDVFNARFLACLYNRYEFTQGTIHLLLFSF